MKWKCCGMKRKNNPLFGVVCDYVVLKNKALLCIYASQRLAFSYDVVTDYAEQQGT